MKPARVTGAIGHAWRGTVNGVRLGVLDEPALARIDERYYESTDIYVTEEWNERGLMDWEQAVVDELFVPGDRLLVVACGGGREVLALLRSGYDAYGCESHLTLSAFGDSFLAERGHSGRIEPAGRDEVPAGPPCHGIIIGWGAYSLVGGRAARIRFLAGARARLPHGGYTMLSCFGRRAPGRELRWTAGLANGLRRLRRATPVELGETLAPNRVRVFSYADLADEASNAGFALVRWQLLGAADGATRYTVAVLRAQ
jgi:hypothetical protein